MGNSRSEPIKVLGIDYHRNGVCGSGFYVILFTTPDVPNETMVAVSFECENAELRDYHEGEIAVLGINELAKKNIKFANGNSYRYEFFADEIKSAIADYTKAWRKEYGLA